MKIILLNLILLFVPQLILSNESDSLLNILDESISKRSYYFEQKENSIGKLKTLLKNSTSKEVQFEISKEIMDSYSYYINDSALYYSNKCLNLAIELENTDYQVDIKLKRAYVLSFSELFHESFSILESIDSDKLSLHYKGEYYRTYLLVYDNQIKDLDDLYYRNKYKEELIKCVDKYLSIGQSDSLTYLKVLAYKYYMKGLVKDAAQTVNSILNYPDISPYENAEFLFRWGTVLFKAPQEYRLDAKKALTLAAIECNQLAITKNPPLIYLARILLEEGDTDRAYNYIQIALNDAMRFSNKHRLAHASQIQSLIQDTYYTKISSQKTALKYYSVLSTLLLVFLGIVLAFLYYYTKTLKATRAKLFNALSSQEETNYLKDAYIGYYLNLYSVFINKCEDIRKNIIRLVKTKQYDKLSEIDIDMKMSTEKEMDDLFANFDKTFLELYPYFVEGVNSLIVPEEQYTINKKKETPMINTELRILALLKLGITDNKSISSFLSITLQTVYNYRSKIKAKAINESTFEEDVKKIKGIASIRIK